MKEEARKAAERIRMYSGELPREWVGRWPEWERCQHVWRFPVDSQGENDVYCSICHCPGEVTPETGEVFWPTT